MKLFKMAAVAATLVCALNTGAQAQQVAIGTLPQGSLAYASGAAVARVLGEQTGWNVSVVPQGGPPVTLPMVSTGELDFSFATAIAAAFAYKGIDYPEPLTKLRIAATVYPLDFSFFVRADSKYQAIGDLAGESMPWGFSQQRNNGAVLEAYLASAGLGEKDIRPVLVPNAPKALDDFVAGRIAAASFSMGSGREKEVAASVGGIRYLGLPEDDEVDALVAKMAPGALTKTLKAGEYEFADRDIKIIYSPFVIMASENTPDEEVYALVKALHTAKNELGEAVASFKRMDVTKLAQDVGIPLHPGAEKYLREAGLLSQ